MAAEPIGQVGHVAPLPILAICKLLITQYHNNHDEINQQAIAVHVSSARGMKT